MKIFDSSIKDFGDLINNYHLTRLNKDVESWPLGDKNALIFKSDVAFELGGGNLPGLSGILLTDNDELFGDDDNILIGNDLDKINNDTPYARMMIVKVKSEKMGEGNEFYQNIRRIDYSRYHIEPKDMMMLISSLNQKEVLRISKKAIKDKRSLSELAKLFNESYAKLPTVQKVKTVFITLKDFDYSKLGQIIKKTEDITKALDHLVNKVKMDCHSCSLQVVCAEVEELTNKELHK